MRFLSKEQVDFAPGEDTFGLGIVREVWADSAGRKKTIWKYALPHVVVILGLTAEGQVIAVEEFQPGVGKTYLHLPSETLEEGESWVEAAQRGLLEETGYQAGNIELLTTVLENSGRSDRLIFLVTATGCQKVQDSEREIRVQLFEPAEFWNHLLEYFLENPEEKHGGGNTLKALTLGFAKREMLRMDGSENEWQEK